MSLIFSAGLTIATPSVSSSLAIEKNLPATVTVTAYEAFTLIAPDSGLDFGSIIPGTADNPVLGQSSQKGAVQLVVAIETNITFYISLKADDFTNAAKTGTIPISNTKCNINPDLAGAFAVTKQYTKIVQLTNEQTKDLWLWLSLNMNQVPDIYTTTFYIKSERV